MNADPRNEFEYGKRQAEAARRVLIDVGQVLADFQDCLVVVGGWTPDLLFENAEEAHIGSMDVDFALDAEHLQDGRYGPAPELSAEERAEVKKVAKDLLGRLKGGLLVLNWRKKPSARSRIRLAIDDGLDSGLPRAYTPELYAQKCAAVFEHICEAYPESR